MNDKVKIIEVTPENVAEVGVFCIKDKKAAGFQQKVAWFQQKINEGLKIQIATDEKGKQLGFIEYLPSELAWRPIKADQYLFIHCIAIFGKKARTQGLGSALVKRCEEDALKSQKDGVCVMSSDGAWMANKSLFEKNGFAIADQSGRFELLHKKINDQAVAPKFHDWQAQLAQYEGWHLIYANQCPWHEKSVSDLGQVAFEREIGLQVTRLDTPQEAQEAPSGFGTFALIRDGKLLADHYISQTRFRNILKKELGPE